MLSAADTLRSLSNLPIRSEISGPPVGLEGCRTQGARNIRWQILDSCLPLGLAHILLIYLDDHGDGVVFGEINRCVCPCKGDFLGRQVYEAASQEGSCVLGVGKVHSLEVGLVDKGGKTMTESSSTESGVAVSDHASSWVLVMRTRPQLPTWSLLRRAGHVPSSFCHASGIGVISDWTVCFSLGLPPVGLGSRDPTGRAFPGVVNKPSLPFLRSTKVTLVPTTAF